MTYSTKLFSVWLLTAENHGWPVSLLTVGTSDMSDVSVCRGVFKKATGV